MPFTYNKRTTEIYIKKAIFIKDSLFVTFFFQSTL